MSFLHVCWCSNRATCIAYLIAIQWPQNISFIPRKKLNLADIFQTIWIFLTGFLTVLCFRWVWCWNGHRCFDWQRLHIKLWCIASWEGELQFCGWALWWDHVPQWCSAVSPLSKQPQEAKECEWGDLYWWRRLWAPSLLLPRRQYPGTSAKRCWISS